MDKFCFSCSAPLNAPGFQSPAENYCTHCADEDGKLRSREEIQEGLAQWFQSWQPDLEEKTALARAEHFMKAMPEWAD
ncbi:MAG: zinc ribbon domain-containing protein [Candidatus Krumholzibacteria bacterium]|nr:zinc ribbon domain-containing protein [Candidatus Krumholzibacteria bacterium]